MNITGAIFDFDGTVFDSMHIWKGVKFQFFDRIGLVLNEEQREEFKKLFLLDAIELAKTRFDLKMTDKELFDEFFTLIKEKYLADTEPKNDIIEFLEKYQLDITELDYDMDNEEVKKYNVGNVLPVVIFLNDNGIELERLVGEQKEDKLVEVIEKYKEV